MAIAADDAVWLRFVIRRLRLALRYAKDPRAIGVLREIIEEAETRLAQIERRE